MVLYLENLGLTEKLRIFIPQPRQAAKRYGGSYAEITQLKTIRK